MNQLSQVSRLTRAIMPNGCRCDGRLKPPGDLLPAPTGGFKFEDAVAAARFYDISLDTYLQNR